MTIWRGPGGTGSASSEVDTTQFQEFLVQAQAAQVAAEAARDAALAAETNAELAETNAETAEVNAEAAAASIAGAEANAIAAAESAQDWATKTSGTVAGGEYSAKYHALNAATSASSAASSAASINPATLVSNTGSYADPTWITSLAGSKVTGNISGNAANVTGTVAIANGGTGQTTRQNAMDALAGSVTSGQYLRGNGTDVVMSAIQAADVPTLNQNTTGTASNVTGTVAVANGGTGVTTSTGTGSVVLSTSPTLTTPNINSAQFATVSGTAPIYPCRAWVNFNGTGTVAIRASGNVSSITDNGTGDYTVNFTTAMSDANYSAELTPCRNVEADTNMQAGVYGQTGYAAGSVRLQTRIASSSGLEDAFAVNVAIFR